MYQFGNDWLWLCRFIECEEEEEEKKTNCVRMKSEMMWSTVTLLDILAMMKDRVISIHYTIECVSVYASE